jgi:hypothetical protein
MRVVLFDCGFEIFSDFLHKSKRLYDDFCNEGDDGNDDDDDDDDDDDNDDDDDDDDDNNMQPRFSSGKIIM